MKSRDLFRLVWSNLNRMRARAAMSGCGVLIGTSAIIVLISLAVGLQRSVAETLSIIGPLNEITIFSGNAAQLFGSTTTSVSTADTTLTPRRLAELADLPGVAAVTPREQLMVQGNLKLNRLTGLGIVVGIDAKQLRYLGWETTSGSLRLQRWQVLVGARVAGSFVDPRRGSAGANDSEVDLQGQTIKLILSRLSYDGTREERTVRLRVVGVLAERGGQDDYSIFISLPDAQELTAWSTGEKPNWARDGYSQVTMVIEGTDQVLSVEQELRSQGFFTFTASSVLQSLNTLFIIVQVVLGGIGSVALLVAAIGIANTLTMAIYERTREIGLMKALGATNRDVMSVFLVEAGSIGLLGGLGGVVVGIGASRIVNWIAQAYLSAQSASSATEAPPDIAYTPLWLVVLVLAFATSMGVASGIYPAQRAVHLDPVAALKHD